MLMGNFIADFAQVKAELGSDVVIMSLSPGSCKVVLQLGFQGAGKLGFQGAGIMCLWIPAFIGNADVQVLKGGNSSKVRLVCSRFWRCLCGRRFYP